MLKESDPRNGSIGSDAESKVNRWPRGFGLALCLVGLFVAGTAYRQRWRPAATSEASTWRKTAKVLEQMVLYQKVRQLKTLSDEEMKKHQIDVVALPAFGPEFWQHEELHLLERQLGYKTKLSDGSLEITRESSRDVFVRVSKCWCDVSLICLKMMAALLSLEASIHVCNLPFPEMASTPSVKEFEGVWAGNRRLASKEIETSKTGDVPGGDGSANARRLAFNVPSASVQNKSLEEARMSCASQINGIISSVLAVSQYISDSVYTCPAPQNVKSEYQAKRGMSISVLTSGVEKSAAALSDIAVECRDPTMGDVPYSKAVKPGREDILLAACLNNIGQALSYIGKIGYQLNDLATAPGVCPEYSTSYERYVCTENIGSLLADLGQVATYLSAAASGCGHTTLVPFSCSSRIAATVTGMFDAVQGIGGALAWCNHPGPIQRKVAHKVSEIQEQLHNKLYSHSFPLP